MKIAAWIVVGLMLILTGMFAYSAMRLNALAYPREVPQIVIIGQIQEVTFHGRTVWYIDYMIDGYPQGVTLYNEDDIQPFLAKLAEVGEVSFVKE